MLVLGIETSCDETAVAIIDDKKKIYSNKIYSQIDLHKKFGGVVPEIAARSHVEFLPYVLEEAIKEANMDTQYFLSFLELKHDLQDDLWL